MAFAIKAERPLFTERRALTLVVRVNGNEIGFGCIIMVRGGFVNNTTRRGGTADALNRE